MDGYQVLELLPWVAGGVGVVALVLLVALVGGGPGRRYETFVALRYIKSRKRSFISVITLFSILGVVLGVSTLTFVMSLTGGFQEAFREKVLGINSHILVMKYGINFREYKETMEVVRSVPGVEASSPFIFHEMMVSHDKRFAGVLIKGIDPALAPDVSELPRYVTEGSLEGLTWEHAPRDPEESGRRELTSWGKVDAATGESAVPGILLGDVLANKLQVKVGDRVSIVSPLRGLDTSAWAPTQMAPTGRDFRVAGIYRSGFYEYDTKLVMVDYRALQDFFNQGDVVTGIEIRVRDVFAVGAIGEAIRTRLPPGRFRVLDWREINRNLFTSLKLQKLALSVILTFIVIVACFNIVATLIMLVLDKGKEIAILKSMGASNLGVMRIFIIQGMVIGGLGTALGLLLGFVLCVVIGQLDLGMDPKVYLIDRLPVKMEVAEFAIIAAVSLTICFLATIYPAWRASRLPPVEGLRFD